MFNMIWRSLEYVFILLILNELKFYSLGVGVGPLSREMVFFEPKHAEGTNTLFSQTSQNSFMPLYMYRRLFDGNKESTDIHYFWATDNQMCLHVYLKKMVFLKNVIVYIHANQLANVKDIVGIMTDGFTAVSRSLLLDRRKTPGHITLYPECGGLAVTNRFRVCWVLKSKDIWFGLNEVEVNADPDINAEPNILRYRTLQAEMEDCEAYRAIGPPQLVDNVEPLRNWSITFEQPHIIKSMSALVAVVSGQDRSSLSNWAKIRLGNGSTVMIPPGNCSWGLAPENLAPMGSALMQWQQVKCRISMPPSLGIVLADGLRISDFKVQGDSYRYPRPVLTMSLTESYEKVKLTCRRDKCTSHQLLMYDDRQGYLPAVVNGTVVDGVPLIPFGVNVSKTSADMLVVSMPLDYEHIGRFMCTCNWKEDNSVLQSNAIDVEVDPLRMPRSRVLETVLSDFVFDYKFTWDARAKFKSTKLSYILYEPNKNKFLSTRMRVISYRSGKENKTISFEKGSSMQPRSVKICRTSKKRFCVPGYEFLQPVQFHRINEKLKVIQVPVWLGFINAWKNYTIHVHKKGQFDFWIIEQTGDSLLVDVYCPVGVFCSGNLTQTSMACNGQPEKRPITNLRVGHNNVLKLDRINPMASYKLCLQRDDTECPRLNQGLCRKCINIGSDRANGKNPITNILKPSTKIIGYSSFVENKPQKATLRIAFDYDAKYKPILRCAKVGLKSMNMQCDEGSQQERSWKVKRLRTVKVRDLPLNTICRLNFTISSTNESLLLTTTVDTKFSPFTDFKVEERMNSTHARLEWYTDPSKFPKGYLKNYRLKFMEQKCNGTNWTTEIEQGDKTFYTFPVKKTNIYTVTVLRVITFKSKLHFIRSLPIVLESKPSTVDPPKVTGVAPINRDLAEIEINFQQYSGCLPSKTEVMMGEKVILGRVEEENGVQKVLVNTSSLEPMTSRPLKVRATFGSVVTPWSTLTDYQIPIDTTIVNSKTGQPVGAMIELKPGSTNTFKCSCRNKCPGNVQLEWNRGWIGGDKTGKGESLVLSDLGADDSGRYVCLYRRPGADVRNSTADNQGVAATLMVIVKQKAGSVSKVKDGLNNVGVSRDSRSSVFAMIFCLLLQPIRLLAAW